MKFINFPIVRFVFFLILGILTAHFFRVPFFFLKILLPLFLLLFVLYLIARKQLFPNIFFGIVTYLCFFSIGFFSYQIRLPKFQQTHFSHKISEKEAAIFQLKITQTLKPDNFNNKYFAEVNAINGVPAKGKILLNISKDSLRKTFTSDEILLVDSSFSEIPKPLNPYQFDYSGYMKSLGVYGQLRISEKVILKKANGKTTITGIAEKIRSQIINKLEGTKLKTNERAIIQALILGEKKDIDKQLYSEYASAGAVHILAVSGLHVGILYLILGFLLRPLKRFPKGIILHSVLIVFCLWTFAVISGLSPSVSRAVTMFSFFAFAELLKRPTNSLNTLFLSLLVLLVFNPLWLFQVGFQLSYLAVFFIVWLQPMFQKMWYPKKYFVRKIWGIVTVTICAQLGVLPLSLYYFHQFPGLFLLTNLVVLPGLGIIMGIGLILVLLAIFEMLPNWFAEGYNFLIEALNNFIHWIAIQDEFLFSNIHFSVLKVSGMYLLIFALALFWKQLNYKTLMVSMVSISVYISIFIFDKMKNSSNEFVVFQKSRTSLFGYKNGADFILFKNASEEISTETYPIKSYKVATGIDKIFEEKIPKVLKYNSKTIMIMDSLEIFPKTKKVDYLILTQRTKVNLSRLIDSLKPKQIIADGSNYTSYVKRWEETCRKEKLPFHHTGKTGAFQIE